MKKSCYLLTLIASTIILVSSCTNWKNEEIQKKYYPLISSYTGGEILSKEKIVVTLSKELDLKTLDSTKYNNLVDVSSSADYKVSILTSSSIKIEPLDRWESGEKMRVRVNLNKIFQNESEPFLFDVFVKKAGYSLVLGGYQPVTIQSGIENSLNGTLSTLENENIEDIKKGFEASQGSRNLPVEWSESGKGSFKFIIKDIKRSFKDEKIEIEFNGETIGSDKDTKLTYTIPSINTYKVLEVMNPQASGEPFRVLFSDALQASQDMEGLFMLKEGLPISVTIEKNSALIYLQQDVSTPLELIIDASIANYKGQTLGETQRFNLSPLGENPSVQFISKGTIYPSGSPMIVPFSATNLRAVTLRVVQIYENNIGAFLQDNEVDGRSNIKRYGNIVVKRHLLLDDFILDKRNQDITYGIDLTKLITPQPGSLYMLSLSFVKEFATLPCSEAISKEALNKILEDTLINRQERAYFSSSYYYEDYSMDNEYDYENYNWDDYRNPCSATFYMENHSVSKTVMISDIGIICNKLNDNDLNIITSSINSTEPLSGTSLKVYNLQNQLIGKGTSNGDGIANIKTEQQPFYIIASNGKERGYLKFSESNKQSSTPFETDGYFATEGIKGFLYGDRGVWRPNDTIHLSFMLKDADNRLPEGHPIIVQLYDNQGRLVKKDLHNKGDISIYSSHFHIPETSSTGYWRAEAVVGGATFSMPVRVETIRPNRLKINMDIEDKIFTLGTSGVVNMSGNWLTGLPASNMKFDATYTISKISEPFPQFSEYTFENPFVKIDNQEANLMQGELNEEGKYTFNEQFLVNPEWGLVKAKVKVRLFETGGDFSTDFFETKLSTTDVYCGIKLKEDKSSNPSFIPINVIALDALGKQLKNRSLNYSIYRIGYSYWWEDSHSTSAEFFSSNSHQIVQKGTISTSNGEGIIEFKPTSDRYWENYIVIVDGDKGGYCSAYTFCVIEGKRAINYRSEKGADDAQIVRVTSKESKYGIGDQATVSFPTADGGNAIVTIFKGDKILKQEIIETSSNSTQYKFKVTEDMIPNIYLSVNVLQKFADTKLDIPVRMYGIANINVEDESMNLKPEIKAPAVIRPNSETTIEISEKNDVACDYTIAIVDEGLLDITRFKTPNPYNYFFQKEGYSIESYDLYNFVLGGYFGSMEKVFGIGGDMGSLGTAPNQKASRFKPMVRFMGPFHLHSGKRAKHKIDIPYYVGAVRIMVVAAGEHSYGSTERSMKVKNDFMIVTSLPRVLSPNDEIIIPVTLLSDSKETQNIKMTVQPSKHFITDETLQKEIQLLGGKDETVYFKFKIGSNLGQAKFKVVAKSGSDELEEEIDIEVRNPNLPSTHTTLFELQPNQEKEFSVKNSDWINLKATLELSTAKSLNLHYRIGYLIRYPHGCVEQTTSAAFPQLYLNSIMNLSVNKKAEIESNIKIAINKLEQFQKPEGGFSYWRGGSYSDDWGSSYVGHFLLEAQRMGYNVPASKLKSWLAYQTKLAREWSENDIRTDGYYTVNSSDNQAYRLFTLALAQKPDMAAMNRLRSSKKSSVSAKWLLAYSYALAGQSSVANSLVSELKSKPFSSDAWEYSYGSEERDRALMLNTLVYLNRNAEATEIANILADKLNSSEYMNTQAVAMSLVAMSNFYSGSELAKNITATVQIGEKSFDVKSINPMESFDAGTKQIKVKNLGSGKIFGAIIETGTPLNPVENSYNNNISLQIRYLDKQGLPITLSDISQNNDIVIEATVKNTGINEYYRNLALTQIVPAGWEIRNLRLEGNESLSDALFTYQDIRDDRVFTYFDLAHGQTKVFELHATPSYKGTFYLPATTCESMYSNKIAAQFAGQIVIVK